MGPTENEKDKFRGRVHYYHRQTQPGKFSPPSALDWGERQKLIQKKHRQRVLIGLVAAVIVLGLVVGTYLVMVP